MSRRKRDSIIIKLKWLDAETSSDLNLPSYETPGSAGMDVSADLKTSLTIEIGAIAVIPTGFAVEIPEGYEIQIRPRSGLAMNHGITLINSPGTIDADYRGEVKIGLINLGQKEYVINRGERIAQFVVAPVAQARCHVVDSLNETERGEGGFGHTGVK